MTTATISKWNNNAHVVTVANAKKDMRVTHINSKREIVTYIVRHVLDNDLCVVSRASKQELAITNDSQTLKVARKSKQAEPAQNDAMAAMFEQFMKYAKDNGVL